MDSMDTITSFHQIDQRLADRKPLYIRNTTRKPAKIVVIDYPTPEGGRGFSIPRVSIPFNICDFVDPEGLRNSSSFRKMFHAGVLEVVPDEEAQHILSDPSVVQAFREAYAEANNMYRHREGELRKNREAAEADRSQTQRNNPSLLAALDPKLAELLGKTRGNGEPKMETRQNPRLNALESRIKAGAALDSKDLIKQLSLMLGDLDNEDLAGIQAAPFYPEDVRVWAGKQIR